MLDWHPVQGVTQLCTAQAAYNPKHYKQLKDGGTDWLMDVDVNDIR